MKITKIVYYDGARDKVCRLGLSSLFLELQEIILETYIEILEEKDANGAAAVRKALDANFEAAEDWLKTTAGGTDWAKKVRYNKSVLSRIGVEVQVSARSDMVVRDMVHLRNDLQAGKIDVGAIVIPSERLQYFLPDRTPSFRDAKRCLEEDFKEGATFPIILIAIEHDAVGTVPLEKAKRKS